MTVITDNSINIPKTVTALGFFDGVHLGHQSVINELRGSSLTPAVFTFCADSRLPGRMFPERILTNEMKLERLSLLNVGFVYAPMFSEVQNMTSDEFVQNILIKKMNSAMLVCGFDFRFGRDLCDAEGLKKIAERYGISVKVVPPFSHNGCIVHSTEIKKYISSGEMKKANELLGYDFPIENTVIEGNHIGREIDCPTINQLIPENIVLPKFGVYKSMTIINGRPMLSVSNIGIKPTVNYSDAPLCETHILGYSGNLYGKTLRVHLLDFVRPERKFSSLSELKNQLENDKKSVKSIF